VVAGAAVVSAGLLPPHAASASTIIIESAMISIFLIEFFIVIPLSFLFFAIP
jgi:hypothetical protein